MRRISISSFCIATTLSAGLAVAQDIGGNYLVRGTNFDGSIYNGEARIDLTSDVTCEIAWSTDGIESAGICMRSGNVFSAAYVLDGAAGLIIYEVLRDGTLSGTWTIAGLNAVGTEILTPR